MSYIFIAFLDVKEAKSASDALILDIWLEVSDTSGYASFADKKEAYPLAFKATVAVIS